MIKTEFSFDDGSIYDLRTADILKQYGYNAIFYIPVNWQKYLANKRIDSLSYDDVIELSKHFTIGSHGVNHELLTQVSDHTQDYEINESLNWWKQSGIDVTSFCYARGYFNDDIKAKVKKAGYKTARTVKIGYLNPATDPYETNTTLHIGYDRSEYGMDWLSYAKLKVTEALQLQENGESVIYRIFGHSEELHRYQQWDNFGLFLRYLNENMST